MIRGFLAPLAAALCGVCAAPAAAAEGDFTFRRVAVPAPGVTGPRITVQIDPAEQARLLAAAPRITPRSPFEPPAPGAQGGSPGALAWFWDTVPAQAEAGRGRFFTALAALDAAPSGARGVPAPRLQTLQDIAARNGPAILQATAGTRVSPALVIAVIAVESAGRTQAVSHKGAQGLMQLIPATAARFGVADVFDPPQNIRGGVAYLDWLLREFDGDVVLALAGYNAGEGAVRRNGGVPPFAETRDYVPKVLAAWRVARGLCLTPPELPSDGCVFRVAAAS
jgi:soluble lytic murein transglycosylase-like protein